MTAIDAKPTERRQDVLTDDMLARFDERAPDLRPREPLLPRGLRGAARQSGYLKVAVPPSSEASA